MKRFEHGWFDYGIRSNWLGGVESPAAVGEKFINTLDALSYVNSIFADWQVMDRRKKSFTPAAEARPRITAIIEDNVARDDFGNPNPTYGYSATARTKGCRDASNITFRANGGGERYGGTWLQFGEWDVAPDPAIVTYPLFKKALLAINTVWLPPWACAYAFRIDYSKLPLVPDAPLFPASSFHIPWIGYLSASLIIRMSLPREIMTERTPDGGLLLTATEERLDPTNPEHLRRARILAEVLIKQTGDSSR